MIEFIIVILFQKSGAYIFRPNNSMTFPIGDNPEISLVEVSLCYFGLIQGQRYRGGRGGLSPPTF